MTDEQKKILAYLKKRKTPADLKSVRLQTKIDKQTTVNSLNALLKKGCIKTSFRIDPFTKERVWEWVKDEYEVKSVYGVRFWHGRLTPIAKGVKQFLEVESKKAPSPPLPDATLGVFLYESSRF